MAGENIRYLIPAGDLFASFLDDNDAPTTWFRVPNAKFELKMNSDKIELFSKMTANPGAALATHYQGKPGEMTISEIAGFTKHTWRVALGADLETVSVTGATVTAEQHTITELDDSAVQLAHDFVSNVRMIVGTDMSVTFTDAGDVVTDVAHGLVNGDRVQFSAITSTTGISTYTPYYVVNKTNDTYQVSLTAGGAAIALTTDGSGTAQKLAAATEFDVRSADLGLVAVLSGGDVAVNDTVRFYYTYGTYTGTKLKANARVSFNMQFKGLLLDQDSNKKYRFFAQKVSLINNGTQSFIDVENYMSAEWTGTPISVDSAEPYQLIDVD